MANLSAYLNFSVTLRYDLATKVIRIVDTSAYPVGVNAGITGIVSITQPDGIVVSGSFASPDVTWSGSALTVAEKELRVATNGQPQNGSYTVTYTVRHASYDDTTLTRVFTLNFTQPELVITKAFDVFTPEIRAIDTTDYDVTGLLLQNVTRSWSADIGTVGSTTGSTQEFDIAYSGQYYDAEYDITLESTVEWDLSSFSYVTIFKKISKTVSGSADTPKTIADLRDDLDAFKLELDALINNSDRYETKNTLYTKASLLFQQMVDRGRNGELTGLEDYHYEIVRLLNDGVSPSYTNTNTAIAAYNWGVGSGSATWASITGKPQSERIQWVTGDVGFPAAGTSTLTDARLSNVKIIYFRNGIQQYKGNPGDGDSYYDKPDSGAGSNILTVYGAWQTGDKNVIYTWPL